MSLKNWDCLSLTDVRVGVFSRQGSWALVHHSAALSGNSLGARCAGEPEADCEKPTKPDTRVHVELSSGHRALSISIFHTYSPVPIEFQLVVRRKATELLHPHQP